ncbi:MAG: hypothetical protein LEGION0403_FIIPPAGN_01827 [Legionella sp.]|uniref:Tn3 family transposase n=1 Tax=Legionella sp. TaxID=459 RepID=UPI003D0CB79C
MNQAIECFHRDIAYSLPDEKRALLQDLITPEHKGSYSRLTELKKSPANANSTIMNEYLAYFEQIQTIGILECDLSAIHPDVIAALAKKGRYYDVAQLREISSTLKREAIIIYFLYETVKNILDYLMNMYKRILLDINRKPKNEVSAERVRVATKNKGKLKPASDFIRPAFSQEAVKNLSLIQFKDLADQNIYKIDKAMSYGDLDDVFSGTADIELARENWDQIVRIVASLKNGLAPAHVIIQKLANRTDNVSKAIRAFGRIIKTIYILRYIADQELRYTVHLHLNQGESRHHLAKKLFLLNRGVFKTSDYEEIMNKASWLSLVSNTVLIWNTHHIQKIVDKLRAEGHVIPSEHLQKISALMFKHIQIHGTYHFEDL